ncbi:hypothetical protein PVAND_016770 [Polypedilum vanderplanki]|uniref:Ion transport domain-containing protein n=1 Tax=Polypedilum vanderplanki TaxID=319348 RepID=A0A9J6BGR9_POLVA|nr:hypothetical protein PVAND_016770 [Polypedilum vanderplanki]
MFSKFLKHKIFIFRTQEIHYYTTLMLLRNGHELGKNIIPHEWVTPAVLYEFFDSQISYYNKDLIEINVSGLLHCETKKTVVKSAQDVTEKMMLWDDDRTLQYLLEHKNISHIITHPVVSTFIELKYAKHKMIFRLNFWFFVFFFVLPFSLFVFFNDEKLPDGLFPMCILSIFLFAAKELFQFQIAKESRIYLRDLTNKIDIPLIILSIFLLVSYGLDWHPEIQALFEVIFIFVMTWDAMTMLPIEAVSRTLMIIKKVTMTFVRVFSSFALIILAFAFSFRIFFGSDYLEKTNGTFSEPETTEREPNIKNFEGIFTTFVKVLVMMAGEYTIEPSKLRWYQLVLFGIFVVFSFLLFNLLLGMSIEDIQNLRAAALERDLAMKAKKFIETNDKFEEIYAERTYTNTKYISISNKLIYRVSRLFLSEYIYLHNFRKIFINIRTREVTVNINEKHEPIMKRKISWLTTKYHISQEVLERIEDIISLRDQENCLNIVKRH